MLINLLPDFLDILAQSDREAAYRRFLDAHRPLLAAYWNNYVLDLDSPSFARFDDEDARGLNELAEIFIDSSSLEYKL